MFTHKSVPDECGDIRVGERVADPEAELSEDQTVF
jgi:hypothetical protein